MLNEILTTVGFDAESGLLGFKCTVLGRYGVYIEGAKSILKFQQDSVEVMAGVGRVRVSGKGLTLRAMTKTDVVVGGDIYGIEFVKDGEKEESRAEADAE